MPDELKFEKPIRVPADGTWQMLTTVDAALAFIRDSLTDEQRRMAAWQKAKRIIRQAADSRSLADVAAANDALLAAAREEKWTAD